MGARRTKGKKHGQSRNPRTRYVDVWNETDAEKRRAKIADLWVPDGIHYVRTLEARGYEALEKRVIGSHMKNVKENGNRFRAVNDLEVLRNSVKFTWEMIPATGADRSASQLSFEEAIDAYNHFDPRKHVGKVVIAG